MAAPPGIRPFSGADNSFFLQASEGTSLAEINYATRMTMARLEGLEITPEFAQGVASSALAYEADDLAALRGRGIAGNLRQLLHAKRKGDAERCAKTMVIDHEAFGDLIRNPGAIGMSHYSKQRDFVPPARALNDLDRETLFAPAGDVTDEERRRVEAKVRQVFVEREHVSAHLFANHHVWHCFYFTFRDMAGHPLTATPHWPPPGYHLHYVSHLWTLTRESVWKQFDQRGFKLPGVHIRYNHPDAGKKPTRFIYANPRTGRVIEVPAVEAKSVPT
jgi:hypothetical protein